MISYLYLILFPEEYSKGNRYFYIGMRTANVDIPQHDEEYISSSKHVKRMILKEKKPYEKITLFVTKDDYLLRSLEHACIGRYYTNKSINENIPMNKFTHRDLKQHTELVFSIIDEFINKSYIESQLVPSK